MSTQFQPLEIPPGVAVKATKKQRSSNWSEVNMVRWREGQLMPMGGQSQFTNQITVNATATTAFTTSSTQIGFAANPGSIRPGMKVINVTPTAGGYGNGVYNYSTYGTARPGTGQTIGTVHSFGVGTFSIAATAAFTTGYRAIAMAPNPGGVIPGMTVTDIASAHVLGTVQSYGPYMVTHNANGLFNIGDTTITMASLGAIGGDVIPGMTVFDLNSGHALGTVASWIGNTLTLTAPSPFFAYSTADALQFSSGTNHVLVLNATLPSASSGSADMLQFSSGSSWLLTLTAPSLSASSGASDILQFSGEAYIFASRCKMIHGWFGLDGIHRVAYLCEANLYVDVNGDLLDITPAGGIQPPVGLVGGYGEGLYNDSTYGTARAAGVNLLIEKIPDAYSLDNFGSILYAMTSTDGRLLTWDPAVGGSAVVQPPASGRGPVPNGRCFVVTQERFIIIFGSFNDGTTGGGGPRRFAWCDQENPGAWDYANVVSQAGFLDIEPASPIICALASRVGVIFWSSQKVYASRFLGLPYIYNYVELADGATPWSPQSMITTSALSLWMSEQGVFSYDGTSVLPVQCMVRSWIDDDLDPVNVREQAFAAHLAEFNEWWWFFPQNGQPYNTRAIVYNYKEGWWGQIRMSRSAGITSSYTSHPIFADGLIAFKHEDGHTYVNAALPFVETFDLNIASGSRLTTVKQMIPDVEGDISNLAYSLFYRMSRSLGDPELRSPPRPVRADGYVDFRTTGRDVRLRIDIASPTVQNFTLGQHLIDAVPRGDR